MSVPLSLRLCCAAAMAPALTETAGQSRLQLPGSPPPVVSSNDNLNSDFSDSKLAASTIKAKVTLSSDLQKTRDLLTPLHGNGYQFLTEKFKKSLQELGIPAKYSTVTITQSPVDNRSGSQSRELSIHKGAHKKMNQPSNGNGPNGTGRQFIKKSSLAEEKALNGHKTSHNSNNLKYSLLVKDSSVEGHNSGQNDLNNVNNKPNQNMCQTTESGSGTLVPTNSGEPQNGMGITCILDLSKTNVSHCARTNQPESDINPIEISNDALKKQHILERRSQFLLRRIRRLQGHQLDSQVKTHLKAFIDFQHQHLQTVASKAIRPFSENTLFNCSDVKNLSTSNLVTLVRRLQASQPKPLIDTNMRNNKKGVLVMEQGVSSESERKSGLLRTYVRHWNDAVDSDETESSSGGESCEEWEDCPVMSDKRVPTPL